MQGMLERKIPTYEEHYRMAVDKAKKQSGKVRRKENGYRGHFGQPDSLIAMAEKIYLILIYN